MPLVEDGTYVVDVAPPLRGALRAEVVRDCTGVPWQALEAVAGDPPAACGPLLHGAADPVIVLVRQGGLLVGLWALRRDRMGPLRRLRRMGGDLQTYDGLMVHADGDPAAIAAAAWDALARDGAADVLQLTALRAADPLAALPAVRATARVDAVTHTVDLRRWASADELVAALPKRKRGSLRRRAKKLAQRGAVVFTAETDPVARVRAVQTAIQLKLAWLDAQGEAAPVFRSRTFQDGLRARAADPALQGDLAVLTLRVGGHLAAVEICTRTRTRCDSFIGAYDPAFAKEGAGTALTLRTIGWAIDQGLQTYDLLPPETAFKREWADAAADVLSATVPLSVPGRLLLPAARDGRRWLKERYQALPDGPRDRVRGALGLLLG